MIKKRIAIGIMVAVFLASAAVQLSAQSPADYGACQEFKKQYAYATATYPFLALMGWPFALVTGVAYAVASVVGYHYGCF